MTELKAPVVEILKCNDRAANIKQERYCAQYDEVIFLVCFQR
jgi:hypothetical protein